MSQHKFHRVHRLLRLPRVLVLFSLGNLPSPEVGEREGEREEESSGTRLTKIHNSFKELGRVGTPTARFLVVCSTDLTRFSSSLSLIFFTAIYARTILWHYSFIVHAGGKFYLLYAKRYIKVLYDLMPKQLIMYKGSMAYFD